MCFNFRGQCAVPAFSLSSITAFLSCLQRLGYCSDQMHVEFAQSLWITTHVVSSYFGSLALREVIFI